MNDKTTYIDDNQNVTVTIVTSETPDNLPGQKLYKANDNKTPTDETEQKKHHLNWYTPAHKIQGDCIP